MKTEHAEAEAVMSLVKHLMALKKPVAIGGGEYVLPFFRALGDWANIHKIDLSRGAPVHVIDFDSPDEEG